MKRIRRPYPLKIACCCHARAEGEVFAKKANTITPQGRGQIRKGSQGKSLRILCVRYRFSPQKQILPIDPDGQTPQPLD